MLHRSYDIVSVRAHCVDMTDTREWLKRSSEKCKLIKLSILAGLEPTRINPIEYESIALTNRLHNLFHVSHTYLASQYIKFIKSTIYPNTFLIRCLKRQPTSKYTHNYHQRAEIIYMLVDIIIISMLII